LTQALLWGLLPATLVAYFVIGVLPPRILAWRENLPISMGTVLWLRVHSINAWAVVHLLALGQRLRVPISLAQAIVAYRQPVELSRVEAALEAAAAARTNFAQPLVFARVLGAERRAEAARAETARAAVAKSQENATGE